MADSLSIDAEIQALKDVYAILNKDEYNELSADVWSLGWLILEVLGRMPHCGRLSAAEKSTL